MNKTFKYYIIVFAVLVAGLSAMQMSKKPTLDWRKSFSINSKAPFGTYVFHQEAEALFDGQLEKVSETPFDYFCKHSKLKPQNYLIINANIDTPSWNNIIKEIEQGSTAFIGTWDLPQEIKDTLNVAFNVLNFEEENTLYFTNRKMKSCSLKIDKMPDRIGFEKIHPQHKILGYTKTKESYSGANFIEVPFGKGKVFVHSEPLFLTNYYLLKTPNSTYTEHVFSYLPKQNTVWFLNNETFQSSSLFRFILSKPMLKYAWWTILGSLVLFTIFNIKRKQRVVPVIESPVNKSLEFVKSIGNLYLQEGNHYDMMAKKSRYFLHEVRTQLKIDTTSLNKEFEEKLISKTGVAEDKIKEAVVLIKRSLASDQNLTKGDLIKLNSLLNHILK